MHFEILVEDKSGKKALDGLVPKIIGSEHTFKVIAYKGIGRIPKRCNSGIDAKNRILLENLPRLLRGYGSKWAGYEATVFVICDLDDKCLKSFRKELYAILNSCSPKPETRFCIAIEEGEAWLLGDLPAVKNAYPHAKDSVLNGYVNDSICGTWELLANAVFPGGASELSDRGCQAIGAEKSAWAENITPHMNVANNTSQSFTYFRTKLLELSGMAIS